MAWIFDKVHRIMDGICDEQNRNSAQCSKCGTEWCDDDDEEDIDDTESLDAYDAALIWMSNGKDEDYMFGYTEEELEEALKM